MKKKREERKEHGKYGSSFGRAGAGERKRSGMRGDQGTAVTKGDNKIKAIDRGV